MMIDNSKYDWNDEHIREGILLRLTNVMEDLDINRKQLAFMIQVPKTTIDNWFCGRNIGVDYIIRICEKFHVSANYLILGLGKKYYVLRKDVTSGDNGCPQAGGLPKILG